jgi:hypothetical protein
MSQQVNFKLYAETENNNYALIEVALSADEAFSKGIDYNNATHQPVTIVRVNHPMKVEYPKFFIVNGIKYRLPDTVNAQFQKIMDDGE